MKMYTKQIVMSFFVGVLLSSCSMFGQKESALKEKNIPTQVQKEEVQPVKGRLDVYASMARSTKYNSEKNYQNLSEVLQKRSWQKSVQDLLAYVNNKYNDNSLWAASQKLDFAILYATITLSDDGVFVHDYLYNYAAQQIALATIKGQSEALFAQRKLKELNRLTTQTEKNVFSLNQRLTEKGALSAEELEYKKSIEVSLYNLKQMQTSLSDAWNNFADFVKTSPKNLHVKGKHFYELEDFDKKNQLSTFQYVARNNRVEFDLARKEILGFNAFHLYDKTLQNYPALKRLEINGFDAMDNLYQQELKNNAQLIVDNLLEGVSEYLVAGSAEKQNVLQREVMNNLGAAILTQLTVDYVLVETTSEDLLQAKEKVASLRTDIRQDERLKKHTSAQLAQLLQKRLKLNEAELLVSQIQGERAVALRALYFHSGLSVFSQELLKNKLEIIEASLKKAFNKDMIEMLSQAKDLEKQQKTQGNTWAKSENWLEELIDKKGKKTQNPIVLPQKPMGDFSLYEEKIFDTYPVMQLGAYRQKKNAEIEWQMLKELYPEFDLVKPKIESSVVNGKMMYRLVVKSKKGGFLDLCNKLRKDKIECVLRQK